eukprot:m.182011 g.182011  ORF g.182011 m.182011 type:complete len:433 (-) comp21496_c3_seq2:441-1739(-)
MVLPRLVLLAVSGGCDSIALCLLAKRQFPLLRALVVDHQLRAESSTEAQQVRKQVESLGIPCRVRRLDWSQRRSWVVTEEEEKWSSCTIPASVAAAPAQGVSAAARHLRYEALLDECAEFGCEALLTGHHLDDQVETILMRLEHNSGPLGLGGMQPARSVLHVLRARPTAAASTGEELQHAVHTVQLLRPLLGHTKAELQAVCRAHHQTWVEDPSNRSPVYRRNALRQQLADLVASQPAGFQQALYAQVQRLQAQRAPMTAHLEALLPQYCQWSAAYGWAVVNSGRLVRHLAPPLQPLLVGHILRRTSGHAYPVRGTTVQQCLASLALWASQPEQHSRRAFTAGGCLLLPLPDRPALALVLRQPPSAAELAANSLKTVVLHPGHTLHWDERFLLTLARDALRPLTVRFATPAEILAQFKQVKTRLLLLLQQQ